MPVRFIARTTSAEGPAGQDMNLVDNGYLTTLRNSPSIASGDFTVQLQQ